MTISRFTIAALALGFFFSLGACDDAQTKKSGQVTPTLQAKAVAVKDTFWIDVRTPAEFAEAHLPEAYNIPLQEFEQQFPGQVPDKNAVVALYCRSGNRSGQALVKAQNMGYSKAFNAGGYAALSKSR